jgi:hypothetical protein
VTGLRPEVARFLLERFPGAVVDRLAGDGSARSFSRVHPASGPSVVVMDYGAPVESPTDDERLAQVFSAAGLPVAAILESHTEIGLLLLEDLGDTSLESALLAEPGAFLTEGQPPDLLLRAVDLAADVSRSGTPVLATSDRAGGPALDVARFRFEMEFFLENFVSGHLGRPARDPALASALAELATLAAESGPKVLCHRDFHSRNLMVRPPGELALVDIQDARWGPDSYDLASIVRDAYLPIPDAWVEPLVRRYLVRMLGTAGDAAFRERLHVVSTQRMLKALGSFGYLARVRSQRYLASIAPTVGRLRRSMPAHPFTASLLADLDRTGALPLDA